MEAAERFWRCAQCSFSQNPQGKHLGWGVQLKGRVCLAHVRPWARFLKKGEGREGERGGGWGSGVESGENEMERRGGGEGRKGKGR